MSQAKLDSFLEESFESYEGSLDRQISQIRNRAFERARIELFTLVANRSKEGKVTTQSTTEIIQRLDRIERLIYQGLNEQLKQGTKESAMQSAEHLNTAIIQAVGIPTLIQLHELTAAVESGGIAEGVLTSSADFLLGLAVLLPDFSDSVSQSTFSRKGPDGLTLRDRLRRLAKTIRQEITRELRKKSGRRVEDVQKSLDRVIKDNGWKVDRLTETEKMFSYRQAVSKAADDNPELITGLRIKDFMHGDPEVHRKHMCYIYAQQDEYGMGKGVYPTGTRKIKNPHPQCRSILLPVINAELLS